MLVAPVDVAVDDGPLSAPERTLNAVVAEEVEGRPRPVLYKPGAPDDRIRYGTCKPAEVPGRLGEGVGLIRSDVARDPPIERGPEVDGYAGVPEIDRRPLGALLDARHRELPFHLVCHHLDAGTPDRRHDTGHRADEDHLVGKRELPEFGGRLSIDIGGVIFRGGTPASRQPFARAITKSPTWSGESIAATTPVLLTTKSRSSLILR